MGIGAWALPPGGARDYYEWNLVVEFLVTRRGHDLELLLRPEVTLEAARAEMLAWHATGGAPGAPAADLP